MHLMSPSEMLSKPIEGIHILSDYCTGALWRVLSTVGTRRHICIKSMMLESLVFSSSL
jgi:hypothetical protein